MPEIGAVSKATINWVEVAEVTWAVPLLNVTILFAAIVSKPVPVIVSVVALLARLAELEVTFGGEIAATMVATCTELLLPPNEVTTAVRLPRSGAVSNVTVNEVVDAAVTWPVPLLKVTILLAAMVSKLVPVIVKVLALLARVLPLFNVTVGGETATVVKPPKGLVQPVLPER